MIPWYVGILLRVKLGNYNVAAARYKHLDSSVLTNKIISI